MSGLRPVLVSSFKKLTSPTFCSVTCCAIGQCWLICTFDEEAWWVPTDECLMTGRLSEQSRYRCLQSAGVVSLRYTQAKRAWSCPHTAHVLTLSPRSHPALRPSTELTNVRRPLLVPASHVLTPFTAPLPLRFAPSLAPIGPRRSQHGQKVPKESRPRRRFLASKQRQTAQAPRMGNRRLERRAAYHSDGDRCRRAGGR